ncbi:MAG: hypothetical protein ACRBI6_00335 [Acidimicrobiales bacterium]
MTTRRGSNADWFAYEGRPGWRHRRFRAGFKTADLEAPGWAAIATAGLAIAAIVWRVLGAPWWLALPTTLSGWIGARVADEVAWRRLPSG